LDFFESMRYSVLDLPEYTLVQKSQIELEPTWVYKTRLLPRTESSRIDASKQVGCLIE
jgi:hypothetical protein